MVNFWENPELVRHVRTEMRPKRVGIAATVSVLLALLVWLMMSQINDLPSDTSYLQSLFTTLACGQAAILILWSFSACSQSIANERVMRTFDFLRTTRLTAGELVTGMLFGVPVMAYFVITLTYGITLCAGVMAGFPVLAIVATYLATLMVGIVLSLTGLTLSMLVEKPRAGGALAILLLWPFSALMVVASEGSFPAFQSLTVVPGLLPLFHLTYYNSPGTVLFFGITMPILLVSVILYATFAAWLLVMLRRNLKREREDIKLLSRWQGIGFAVYLNLLAFGLLDTQKFVDHTLYVKDAPLQAAKLLTGGFVFLNFFIFYAVGLTTLSTPERLKHWWRERGNLSTYFSDDGPSWPWIVLVAAIALFLFAFESTMTPAIPQGKWTWPVWEIVVLLTYAVRDVMFVQWCTLTKMKDAVGKALAFILLYYFTVFSLLAVFHQNSKSWERGIALLTPAGAIDPEFRSAALTGAVLQVGVAVVLGALIHQRLEKRAGA